MSTDAPFPLLEVRGLERHYGGRTAVAKLDFSVHRGEVLALLGPNGAGKTTALSVISGNLAPHAGTVRIAGHDLLTRPLAAKRALGYLPEHPPLYPELTVHEYLRYCARLRGLHGHALATAVTETCERCDLHEREQSLIGQLSKGYRQRVGLAQALIHRPAVLVLDEPTVGLDPVQIRRMRELIRRLAAEAAVVVSTHLLAEASEIATRVLVLHRGRIVHEAELAAATADTRFRLELARPPHARCLSALPGVAGVETVGPGIFLIAAGAGGDPREMLARAALERNWGLLALAPHHPSLEDSFFALVGGNGESQA